MRIKKDSIGMLARLLVRLFSEVVSEVIKEAVRGCIYQEGLEGGHLPWRRGCH